MSCYWCFRSGGQISKTKRCSSGWTTARPSLTYPNKGDQVHLLDAVSKRHFATCTLVKRLDVGGVHPGGTERYSRHALEAAPGTENGVDAELRCVSVGTTGQSSGRPGSRPVRKQPEQLNWRALAPQCPELGAELVDALNSDWPDSVLYAFPPTCIMDRVVEKIQKERPRALLLVTSQFPQAPWFPFLTKWEHTACRFPTECTTTAPATLCTPTPQLPTLCVWRCTASASQIRRRRVLTPCCTAPEKSAHWHYQRKL